MSTQRTSGMGDAARGQALAASLQRAAMAVAKASGPAALDALVAQLVDTLGVAAAFVAAFEEGSRRLHLLAGVRDGEPLERIDDLTTHVPELPWRAGAWVHGQDAAAWPAGSTFAAQRLSAYAACALADDAGAPLGWLVAMDRVPMQDTPRIETLMAIFAARMAVEIERTRAEQELRSAALAASSAHGDEVLQQLVEAIARTLRVDIAFIAVHDGESPASLQRVAHVFDGRRGSAVCYSLAGTPCETLVGHRFCAYPAGVARRFPADTMLADHGIESYAGFSLLDRHERPLGILSIMSRRPLVHLDRLETVLQIFALRAGAEVERLRSEETLRLREEQYRLIFEAASDGFVLRNSQRRTLDANPAFYRMYGFDPASIAAGGGYPAHFPRKYVEEREAQIVRALEGHETHVETIALRADGTPFWIDLRVVPVRYRGQPHVLQVVRDISALREREQALQRSEARLRATVDAAFDPIVGMDAQGRIVEFSAAAERCFGHARADVLGRPLVDTIIPARFRAAHTRGLDRFRLSGEGIYLGRLVETTAVRRDGTEFPVELAISVGSVPEGSIFVGHLRDISARRADERRHAELEERLRQAQKMEAIGQLTGGIAHDFNNILTSVIGYLVLAGGRAERLEDARLVHQLSQAQLAAQRARELIAQMLTFARRGSRGRTERVPAALGPALRQSLSLLRSTLPTTIELDAEFASRVPPVAADLVQIEQVLFNLCINARDAMNGSGQLLVSLRECTMDSTCASCHGTLSGHWVELSVADDGCGLSTEVRERMFEPFFSTKEAGRGSGMGLAMVHGIVHDHGGHVVVEDGPEGGSVFRVVLPAGDGEAAGEQSPGPVAARPDTPLRGRLLLVEDEPTVGAYMSELLEGWGLAVTLCRNPLLARQRFAEAPDAFDVVLTDQTMPHATGVQLAEQLLALRPSLPVLLYTGFDEGLDEDALRRRGVRAVLRKPIDDDVLLDALRRCL